MGEMQLALGEEPPSFRCFLSDPPWPERGAGKSKRGADRHYPVARVRDIPDIIRSSGLHRPAEHAHHWMWVTDNYLREGLWVLATLGWRYVRTAAWAKAEDEAEVEAGDQQIGLGQYLRGSHELLLFAVRGKGMDPSVRTADRSQSSLLWGRRGRHSAKPPSTYDKVEAVSRGPYCEFFARSGRSNWTSWGNEIERVH